MVADAMAGFGGDLSCTISNSELAAAAGRNQFATSRDLFDIPSGAASSSMKSINSSISSSDRNFEFSATFTIPLSMGLAFNIA